MHHATEEDLENVRLNLNLTENIISQMERLSTYHAYSLPVVFQVLLGDILEDMDDDFEAYPTALDLFADSDSPKEHKKKVLEIIVPKWFKDKLSKVSEDHNVPMAKFCRCLLNRILEGAGKNFTLPGEHRIDPYEDDEGFED